MSDGNKFEEYKVRERGPSHNCEGPLACVPCKSSAETTADGSCQPSTAVPRARRALFLPQECR